jgi:hypothetical protein
MYVEITVASTIPPVTFNALKPVKLMRGHVLHFAVYHKLVDHGTFYPKIYGAIKVYEHSLMSHYISSIQNIAPLVLPTDIT